MEQPANGIEFMRRNSTAAAGIMFGILILLICYFVFEISSGPELILLFIPFIVLAPVMIFYIYQSSLSKQLQMRLDKPVFSPGEKITGNLTLDLESDKQARSLKVRFYGMQRRGKHSYAVCKTEAVLSGARTYKKGESFPFSLIVPNDALQYSEDGTHYLVRASSYGNAHATAWYVEAQLDIPRDVDLLKREKVMMQANI